MHDSTDNIFNQYTVSLNGLTGQAKGPERLANTMKFTIKTKLYGHHINLVFSFSRTYV